MESVCERLLEYNIHKERKDWTRFARGKSETFQALDGLVAKGVKVDIGIPNELWHKPSAEITHLKTQCEVRTTINILFRDSAGTKSDPKLLLKLIKHPFPL